MKYTVTLALAAFVLLSSKCKKDIEVPSAELKKIFGKWEWVSSTGGFAGKTITPASAGYQVRLEFNSNGAYKRYKNNSLEDQRNFSFQQETSTYNHQTVWAVSFSGSPLSMLVDFSGNDTLLLNDNAYDGY